MICAVIIAAGGSRRLGEPKQLINHEGKSLIAHTVDCALASACDDVIVVLGAEVKSITAEINYSQVRVVENKAWPEGKASSIRVGLTAAAERCDQLEALLFLTCDQPHISSALLNELIASFWSNTSAPVACGYAGTIGIPAIIPKSWFTELTLLTGEQGASMLLRRTDREVTIIPFPEGVVDIDCPSDVDQLRETSKRDH